MFYIFLNISLTYDISFFDQKENVWPIYVCIYVLSIFNISLHNDISSFDERQMFDFLCLFLCFKYF